MWVVVFGIRFFGISLGGGNSAPDGSWASIYDTSVGFGYIPFSVMLKRVEW
jgi:hypothetical protein